MPFNPTSCLARAAKHTFHNWPFYLSEASGAVCPEQFRFRASLSCGDQILQVTQSKRKGLAILVFWTIFCHVLKEGFLLGTMHKGLRSAEVTTAFNTLHQPDDRWPKRRWSRNISRWGLPLLTSNNQGWNARRRYANCGVLQESRNDNLSGTE